MTEPYTIEDQLAEMTASRDEWRALATDAKQQLFKQLKLTDDAVQAANEWADTIIAIVKYRWLRRLVAYLFGTVFGFVAGYVWRGL